jgi:hypothetical protein
VSAFWWAGQWVVTRLRIRGMPGTSGDEEQREEGETLVTDEAPKQSQGCGESSPGGQKIRKVYLAFWTIIAEDMATGSACSRRWYRYCQRWEMKKASQHNLLGAGDGIVACCRVIE